LTAGAPDPADLPTTGEISATGYTGWSGSTFLVGFQLDGHLLGSSAVIAFPKGGASRHLDDNGKINGKASKQLRLLTSARAGYRSGAMMAPRRRTSSARRRLILGRPGQRSLLL
jgi:hypothetical protein